MKQFLFTLLAITLTLGSLSTKAPMAQASRLC